jgi:hypothetical protein
MRIKLNDISMVNTGAGIIMTLRIPQMFASIVEAFRQQFKPNEEYELRLIRKKRSLDSNSFCWKICTEIANVVGNTKEDVYRDAINHVGVYETLQFADDEAMERFKAKWRTNGEGWLTKTLDKQKRILMAYYGSSSYDTKEMSVLIDYLVREAGDLGIQVLTEEQIELMKTEWK